MFEFFKKKAAEEDLSGDAVIPPAEKENEPAAVPAEGPALSPDKPSAVAFVDYEYWYVALDRHYHTRPDLAAWKKELLDKYDLRDMIVYGNFANASLRAELMNIRAVTENVIDTQVPAHSHKKDQTEFLLLNGIYQTAITCPGTDVFVLFSGDGHFANVMEFLQSSCGKTVDVYAVRDSYSRQLISVSTLNTLIPEEVDWTAKCAGMILANLKYLEANAVGDKPVRPSFRATVDAVSRYRHLPKTDVEQTLCWMLENGYAEQYVEYLDEKDVRLIRVNWDKCLADGLYREESKEDRVPEFVEEPLDEAVPAEE